MDYRKSCQLDSKTNCNNPVPVAFSPPTWRHSSTQKQSYTFNMLVYAVVGHSLFTPVLAQISIYVSYLPVASSDVSSERRGESGHTTKKTHRISSSHSRRRHSEQPRTPDNQRQSYPPAPLLIAPLSLPLVYAETQRSPRRAVCSRGEKKGP